MRLPLPLPAKLTLDELLASNVRLHGMEIFPTYKINLEARPDGKFDAIFRAQELNGFGNSKLQALVRMFSGILFEEITPEYYNARARPRISLRCSALIPTNGAQWSMFPVHLAEAQNGGTGWALTCGMRNWTVQTSFTGPAPCWARRIFRRESVSAEISRFVGARWSWTTGLEISHRDFRNVVPGIALTPELLAQGYQVKQKTQIQLRVVAIA